MAPVIKKLPGSMAALVCCISSTMEEIMPHIESRTLEIRAAEGGEDARLFVAELAQAYLKLSTRKG